jgi:hypothetical protein
MSTERTGLLLRGTLLRASKREVHPKDSDAFTVHEARVLADDTVLIVTFFNAEEMAAALRSCKVGGAVELPVYGRAANKRVFLHYRRGELTTDTAAA